MKSTSYAPIAAAWLILFGASAFAQSIQASDGSWSTEGKFLEANGKLDVDARIDCQGTDLQLRVRGLELSVFKGGKQIGRPLGAPWVMEITCAPDGEGFALTSSVGGSISGWYSVVGLVQGDSLRNVSFSEAVIRDAMVRFTCLDADDKPSPEEPNVAVVGWSTDGQELLVVAQVPPHSSCPEMGKLFGYRIGVADGRIRDVLEEKEIRRNWKRLLGPRLRPTD